MIRTVCPHPRWPDANVGEEVVNIPFAGYEDFWSWMSDIAVLNDQLDACRNG